MLKKVHEWSIVDFKRTMLDIHEISRL